ncbi:MAG: mechanosensitive ion channel [Melioribacteraceae bacterium]|nr:mechanosensitive ion channel [Melioribacteraceae bacterium]
MNEEIVTQILEKGKTLVTQFGFDFLIAIAIFIIGKFAVKMIMRILSKVMLSKKMDETVVHFIVDLIYFCLVAFVVLASLSQIGIETTSFIAILGAAGLAIGLALQGSLSNFASGVLLIIFHPFKVGDYINAGGNEGVVENIQVFTTQIKTLDNKAVIIPNSQITSESITNFTMKENRRIDLVFGVSYGDNIPKCKKVMMEVMAADERVLKEPKPFVGLLELGNSSVNFAVRPWVKTTDYWTVFFDLNEKIKIKLDEEGITIPFPQRDVHLYNHND